MNLTRMCTPYLSTLNKPMTSSRKVIFDVCWLNSEYTQNVWGCWKPESYLSSHAQCKKKFWSSLQKKVIILYKAVFTRDKILTLQRALFWGTRKILADGVFKCFSLWILQPSILSPFFSFIIWWFNRKYLKTYLMSKKKPYNYIKCD